MLFKYLRNYFCDAHCVEIFIVFPDWQLISQYLESAFQKVNNFDFNFGFLKDFQIFLSTQALSVKLKSKVHGEI